MTNFTSQLHEDLFDDFAMMIALDAWDTRDMIKELLGQENHPEEFVRYVSDMGLSNIKNGHTAAVVNEKCFWNKHKIKITLENE